MTSTDLAAQCRRQLALAGPGASITLTLPGRWGTAKTKRLWPGGPSGQIVSEAQRGGRDVVIVFASAQEVLDALEEKEGTKR